MRDNLGMYLVFIYVVTISVNLLIVINEARIFLAIKWRRCKKVSKKAVHEVEANFKDDIESYGDGNGYLENTYNNKQTKIKSNKKMKFKTKRAL